MASAATDNDEGLRTPRRRAPQASSPRRRRRRSEDHDPEEEDLEGLLEELGIPNSDRKRRRRQRHRRESIIELLTPPRLPTTTTAPGAQDVTPSARAAAPSVLLDLTTPTPPKSSYRCRRSSGSTRQSIVDLVSPTSIASDSTSTTEWTTGTTPLPSRRAALSPTLWTRLETPERERDPRDDGVCVQDQEEPEQDHASDSEDPPTEPRGSDSEDIDLGDVPSLRERLALRRRRLVQAEHGPSTDIAPAPQPQIPWSGSVASDDGPRHRSTQQEAPPGSQVRVDVDAPALGKKSATTKSGGKGRSTTAKSLVAAVAMSRDLGESETGVAIAAALESNVYNGKPVPYTLEPMITTATLPIIQWERRGGASGDDDRHAIAIHFAADAFLDQLLDQGYARLAYTAKTLRNLPLYGGPAGRGPVVWKTAVVIIEGMDRALIRRKKAKKGTTGGHSTALTFSDLHEVAFQLYMDCGIHTKFACDKEATGAYVALLTRELIVAAVKQSSQEEFLEGVPRVHSFRVMPRTGSTLNPFANTWLRMLQMIQGMSEDKAQAMLDHAPTFQSLLAVYLDPRLSQCEKEDYLANKLSTSRIEAALSKKIFRVFSSWDPSTPV